MSRLVIALSIIVGLAGCASLPDRIPTRPPQGRTAADVAKDQSQCEAYGKTQAKHQGDHYQACMLARGYAANVDMDNLDWVIGVVQTRPHEPSVVIQDMAFCDSRADKTKSSDVVTLTPEQERSIAGQAFSASAQTVPGMAYQQRPNASRMLVACLSERGYAIVPWVPMNAPR